MRLRGYARSEGGGLVPLPWVGALGRGAATKPLRAPRDDRVAAAPGSLLRPSRASAQADQVADAAAQEADQAPELR